METKTQPRELALMSNFIFAKVNNTSGTVYELIKRHSI
jgi:hypothetical protein